MTDISLPGQPIDLAIPPVLAQALGYHGDARFVSFRWTCLGDQVVYDDGRNSGTGQSWSFLAFKRHRAVAPFLRDADLGSSEEDGTQVLLIDRDENVATIAPIGEANAFLDAQWPEQQPLTPEGEVAFRHELERLLEEQRNRPIDWDAIARQQREQSTRLSVILAFFDQQVPPSQGEGQAP